MVTILCLALVSQASVPFAATDTVYPTEDPAAATPPKPEEPPREDPIALGKMRPIQDVYIVKATGKVWLPKDFGDKTDLSAADLLSLVIVLKYTPHSNGQLQMRIALPDELLPTFATLLKAGSWIILEEPLRTAPNDRWYDHGLYFFTILTEVKFTPRAKPLKLDDKLDVIPWVDYVKSRVHTKAILPIDKGWRVLPKVNRVPELKDRIKVELENLIYTTEKLDIQNAKTERLMALHEAESAYIAYYAMGCEEAAANQEWNNTHDIKARRDAYKDDEHYKACVDMYREYRKFIDVKVKWERTIDDLTFKLEKLKESQKELANMDVGEPTKKVESVTSY